MRCRLWCALCLHIALVCNLHIPAAWHGTRVYDESQIVKLKRRSDPSTGLGADNRMYYEPSAQRRIRFYWTRLEEISVVRVPLLPESSEGSTGIVFGGRGKRGDPSCRGGGADACSLFGARDFKEASLLYLPSRSHCIVVYSGCPSAGDNGNGRMLAVTWPAERALLIEATSLHCALLRDCQHDVGRTHVDKGMAYSFRSRSPLFAQGRGAEFLGGMSGIADIPKGRGPYPGRTASDPGSANSTSTTDYVSPAQPHSLSYPRKRRSCPACSPLESSHPFARLQPTTAYLYLPTMIPCHRALVFGSVAPPSKFYCIKGCMPMEA